MQLIGRGAEKKVLRRLLDDVRAGRSRTLVLRGEPGVGKSALLDYAVEHADDLQVVRIGAVEAEQHLGFAALHQLLIPFLHALPRLPEPQRRALSVAFGLEPGPPADPFLVGLAALTLISDAAKDRPVLCVVDDAQWLDQESNDLLRFVARRLLADGVGLVFAIRELAPGADEPANGLPVLVVRGLPEQAAFALLAASIDGPMEAGVAAHLVTQTGGNPLAVIEAGRGLTADQLSGAVPITEPLAVGHRLEESFLRRASALPDDSQTLLLLAAASSPGQEPAFWRAAAELGVANGAAVAAEAAGLITVLPELRFAHPLVRSAVYHAATASQRRRAHRALAEASGADPVTRAWHLAAATPGPDEAVAAALEAGAEQTRSRGGYPASALLLERAAQLTPNVERRAERQLAAAQVHLLAGSVDRAEALSDRASPGLRSAESRAEAIRLRGRVEATLGRVADATTSLVDAARRLSGCDPVAARDALLSAVEAAVFAGWAPSTAALDEVATIAETLPEEAVGQGSAPALLLQGCRARLAEGYASAVPVLRAAVEALRSSDADPDEVLRLLQLAVIWAIDLLDDAATEGLTRLWIDTARRRGALAGLAEGLAFRSAFVEAPSGRLAAARAASAEATELGQVTRNPAVVPPTGAHQIITHALGGEESHARATAAAVAHEAPTRGALGEAAFAAHGLGVLEISLGNYAAAVRCLEAAYADDTPLAGTQALPDLVEAAVRADRRDLAEGALHRLVDRAQASGTPLALGLLARSRALVATSGDARRMYEEAIVLLGRTSVTPQLARTHLLLGEWLRRQRLRRDARDHLHAALEILEGAGFEPFAERTRVELRATGERLRKRVLGDPEELTPREAQIAALVSRGQGNREIAAQLFVSASTVEYHLSKIFRKLGVTSRTQLARRMNNLGGTAAAWDTTTRS